LWLSKAGHEPENATQFPFAKRSLPVARGRRLLHKYRAQLAGERFAVTANTDEPAARRETGAKLAPKSHEVDYPPGFIRPTRAEAQRDPGKFYLLLDFLRKRRRKPLKLSYIKDTIGGDLSTVSRKLKAKRFSEDERELILEDIFERRLIYGSWIEQVQGIPHNLFYAMMDFFEIKETSQDNARAQVVGTYKLWRYSTEFEGEYVLGRIDIEEDHKAASPEQDDDTTALRVKIRQVRKATEHQRGGDEVVEGYFFRISNMYVMLVREALTHNLRCTVFKDFRHEFVGKNVDKNSIYKTNTNHLIELDGFAMGMDGNLAFFSPVHLELVDGKDDLERLDSLLDILPESNVPQRILGKLKRYPRIVR
jgi:hypothetical protein